MIRPAEVGDAPRILELITSFITHSGYRAVFRVDPTILEPLILAVLEHGVCFLAEIEIEDERVVVGMVTGFVSPSPIDGTLVAEELAWWVEVEHRRGSVGPKLLKAFEQWALEHDAAVLKMVAPAGTDVGAYYRRIGYEDVETSWIKRL